MSCKLSEAFGLKQVAKTAEFVPPSAKTPLNKSQLAKRRFFSAHIDEKDPIKMAYSYENSAAEQIGHICAKRDDKTEAKVQKTISKVVGKVAVPDSITQKSLEENTTSNQAANNSRKSSTSTFNPKQHNQIASLSGQSLGHGASGSLLAGE